MGKPVLAARLKQALKKRGLTQNELSKAIGVSAISISQWITGKKQIYSSNLKSVCEALNISADYLLDLDIVTDRASTVEEYTGLKEEVVHRLHLYVENNSADSNRKLKTISDVIIMICSMDESNT